MTIKIPPPITKIQIAVVKRKRIKKVRNKSPAKIRIFQYKVPVVVEFPSIISREKMIFKRFARDLIS